MDDLRDHPVARLLLAATELEASHLDFASTLRDVKRNAILELRKLDDGPTWNEIGDLLGVSGARAEQLSRPERTMR